MSNSTLFYLLSILLLLPVLRSDEQVGEVLEETQQEVPSVQDAVENMLSQLYGEIGEPDVKQETSSTTKETPAEVEELQRHVEEPQQKVEESVTTSTMESSTVIPSPTKAELKGEETGNEVENPVSSTIFTETSSSTPTPTMEEQFLDVPEVSATTTIPQEDNTSAMDHHEDTMAVPPREATDYASALRDLSEMVASLLPVREYLSLAADCREGREAAVISELRGRMARLENQLEKTRDSERECYLEAQATRTANLENSLAECNKKLLETINENKKKADDDNSSVRSVTTNVLVRVELVQVSEDEDQQQQQQDEENVGNKSIQGLAQLTNVLEEAAIKFTSVVASVDEKITEIQRISKETLKFVESVQENENDNDDSGLGEEVTRLTGLHSECRAELASSQQQMLRLNETASSCTADFGRKMKELKNQCAANLTAASEWQQKECKKRVTSSSSAARAQCAAESALQQSQRLAYLVAIHVAHNESLSELTSRNDELKEQLTECERDRDNVTSQLADKESDCAMEIAGVSDTKDDAAQEVEAKLAAMRANYEDSLASLQERCDAGLRLIALQNETITASDPLLSAPPSGSTDATESTTPQDLDPAFIRVGRVGDQD